MESYNYLCYEVFDNYISYFVIGEKEVSGSGGRGYDDIQGFDQGMINECPYGGSIIDQADHDYGF